MKLHIETNPHTTTGISGLEPFVRDAMKRLGTFEEDGYDWLLAGINAVFNKGHMGRELRKIGTPLTPEQRTIVNFTDKYEPLTLEACAVLNDVGIVNPIQSFDDVCGFVAHAYYRLRKVEGLRRTKMYAPWICYVTIEPHCCHAARKLDGKVVHHEEMVTFPLPSCTMSVCRCGFMQMSDRDRRRFKK